ncbi:MAG: hypothetical protein JO144_05665 [Actinobacteria bacterium]|nr:hypothetical protein [Actinomycetota bacterium]
MRKLVLQAVTALLLATAGLACAAPQALAAPTDPTAPITAAADQPTDTPWG